MGLAKASRSTGSPFLSQLCILPNHTQSSALDLQTIERFAVSVLFIAADLGRNRSRDLYRIHKGILRLDYSHAAASSRSIVIKGKSDEQQPNPHPMTGGHEPSPQGPLENRQNYFLRY